MKQLKKFFVDFARDDDGSQVVEYALIIALVSIVLAAALANGGLDDSIGALVTRVTGCMTGDTAACNAP